MGGVIPIGLLLVSGVLVALLCAALVHRVKTRKWLATRPLPVGSFREYGVSGHRNGLAAGLLNRRSTLDVAVEDGRLIVRPSIALLPFGLAVDVPLTQVREVHISRFFGSYQVVVTYENQAGREESFTLYIQDARGLAHAVRTSASPPGA